MLPVHTDANMFECQKMETGTLSLASSLEQIIMTRQLFDIEQLA